MTADRFWLGVGMAGQALFFSRFLVQWIASERSRRSVIPAAFWWFSILGGATLLVYALHGRDIVFIVGQGAGLLIYARNIVLNRKLQVAASEPSLPSKAR